MITLGIDAHKRTHTVIAVDELGRPLGERTTTATTSDDHLAVLRWADRFGPDREWAVEDCWHLSRRLEAGMLAAGEVIKRVPPKLMAHARDSARSYGKSDPIDALAIEHQSWNRDLGPILRRIAATAREPTHTAVDSEPTSRAVAPLRQRGLVPRVTLALGILTIAAIPVFFLLGGWDRGDETSNVTPSSQVSGVSNIRYPSDFCSELAATRDSMSAVIRVARSLESTSQLSEARKVEEDITAVAMSIELLPRGLDADIDELFDDLQSQWESNVSQAAVVVALWEEAVDLEAGSLELSSNALSRLNALRQIRYPSGPTSSDGETLIADECGFDFPGA